MVDEKYKNCGLALFQSDNKLYEIDESKESVKKSHPAIGLQYDNGVLLISQIVDNNLSIMNKDDLREVKKLTERVGATFAGNKSDGQSIMNELQDELLSDYDKFESTNDIDYHTFKISDKIEDMNLRHTSEIYGIELLVGGYDNRNHPSLYHIDADGAVSSWYAYAIGMNQNKYLEYLEKEYRSDMNYSDALDVALNCLQSCKEIDPINLQGCYINEKGYSEIKNKIFKNKLGDQE